MLRRESFPPNDDNLSYALAPACTAHTPIAVQAIRQALISHFVKEAMEP